MVNELVTVLYMLLIGLLAGWLASVIMKRSRRGLLTYLIIGVIGSLLGGFIFRLLGLAAYSLVGQFVTATVGAILLILLLRRIK